MSSARTPLKALSGKPKRCKSCREPFIPSKSLQVACGVTCALALARASQEKQRKALDQIERREIRVRKQKLKSRADYMREAQVAFNAYVRERDRLLPCISCGRHHQGKYDAGHYRTVGSNPALRFEPLNCHKQCVPCNQHKSGDIVNYRINLAVKISADKVAWLEGPHEPKKYTIEELKALKAHYRALLREMKKVSA